MWRLSRFIRAKWEEMLILGLWLPFFIWAVSTGAVVLCILILLGGATSLIGLYFLIDKLKRRARPTFGGEATRIPRRAIVCTVGMQLDTLTYAIEGLQPSYIGFLCTEASWSVVDDIVTQCRLAEGHWRREIVDPQNLDDIRTKGAILLAWLRQQGVSTEEIVVDPTGGLTPMSLGLFSIAQEETIDSQYVRSLYQKNRPIPGTQEVVLLSRFSR